MNQLNTLDVLLVEDDYADVELTRETFQESKMSVNLHVANDGEEALDFLTNKCLDKPTVRPDLILLDLSLPRLDGRELLRIIKGHYELKIIPVVVFSTSNEQDEVEMTYESGANCYVTKPIGLEEFVAVLNSIQNFWFSIARLPSRVKSRGK